MDFKLTPRLFGYFGKNAKVQDSYKDINGQGIFERYNLCVAGDYDDEMSDDVDNFVDRTIVPDQVKTILIPYLESLLGNPVVVLNDVLYRRKILRFAQKIYDIKSTPLSYTILLRMLEFDTITIQEFTVTSGFDSSLTFDDPVRLFDTVEKNCSDYSVLLTGTIPISQETFDAVNRIIDFLEPINADLRDILYNGLPLAVTSGIFDNSFDNTFE